MRFLYCKSTPFVEGDLKGCFTRGCVYMLIQEENFFHNKNYIKTFLVSTNYDVDINLFNNMYEYFDLIDNKKFLIIEKRKIYK